MTERELIEALADKEHASWARWMAYLFSKCKYTSSGWLIPLSYGRHWKQEIKTPYADLPEAAKQSDREEVAHILPIIHAAVEAAYDDVQEFVVLHTFDTSAGRRIDDYITERLAALKAEKAD